MQLSVLNIPNKTVVEGYFYQDIDHQERLFSTDGKGFKFRQDFRAAENEVEPVSSAALPPFNKRTKAVHGKIVYVNGVMCLITGV